LIVIQDIPEEKEYDPVCVLGIDLGIENIALDSDGETSQSEKIDNYGCYMAATNIAIRLRVNQPIIADLVPNYKPSILIGGS
jgi:transposase